MEIFDVPGSYLNADIPEDKFILLNIEEESVDIMCEVNPKHKKNVCVENEVKLLYLRILKALYGCMQSALMQYDLYSKTLKSQGFLINPYDRSISNSTIQDKQCTIAWYLDNNKVSHVDEEVKKKVVETISEILATSQYQGGRNTSSWEWTYSPQQMKNYPYL